MGFHGYVNLASSTNPTWVMDIHLAWVGIIYTIHDKCLYRLVKIISISIHVYNTWNMISDNYNIYIIITLVGTMIWIHYISNHLHASKVSTLRTPTPTPRYCLLRPSCGTPKNKRITSEHPCGQYKPYCVIYPDADDDDDDDGHGKKYNLNAQSH